MNASNRPCPSPRRLQRHVAALAALSAVALLPGACADEAPQPAPDTAGSDGCGPVEEPPRQSGSHLLGDQQPPVPYSSTPPTSGWHASGAVETTVRPPEEPLTEPEQVSVLEAGGVVASYRDIAEEERLELEQHVRRHHEGTVAVTPYEQLERGQVAFTAWGTLQRCEGVDLAALDAFVAAYGDNDPDEPGSH